ncbi:MAG: flagellar hook-basal body complex protein, partial [Eubacteriales bacterium]
MLQALWSASAGMLAQQTSMDTVANNITNINTPGYKKNRVEFQDLLYNNIRGPGRQTRNGQIVENGIQIGTGTRPAATQMLLEEGELQLTGNPTDFAITGNAFFEVLLPDGSKAYTRDGSFNIDA